MHPDPLHTKDLIIIAALIVLAIFAFGALASAVGKAKPIFDAPPVGATY
ncbi:hypothetical protein [Phyllobacterium pellucidum]|nr:hypothetical protein [Phyllobacterium sp. T1018]UGY08587.1 hypothetical protein LLE51_011080 [Phyllobacterium sp. T1018]